MNLSWLKALVFVGLSVLFSSCGRNSEPIGPDAAAPDFRLNTLSHKRFYLNQHKEKVIVLVFWTTWCNIYKTELVELESLSHMPQSGNLVMAGICSDPENIHVVKQITENLGIHYPVLLDEGQSVTARYKISAFPTTVIIDQKGIVRFIRVGYSTAIANQIKTKVASLIITEEGVE